MKGSPVTRIAMHLKHHIVGYVALFVALGGTSYAAASLPPDSVGGAQFRNHAMTPAKLDPTSTTGSIRAWAIVGSRGHVLAGGGRPRVGNPPVPGSYEVRWGAKVNSRCATVVTINSAHSPTTERIPISGNPSQPVTAGYAVANTTGGAHSTTFVTTFNQQGALTPLGFDLAVVC
jgi:hypothetical protein